MPERSLTIEQILTILAKTPPRIAALTAGLTLAQLHTSPNHDEWSANDVLPHMRSGWLAMNGRTSSRSNAS